MKKILKWIGGIVTVIICLVLLSPGILYLYTLNEIKPFVDPSDNQYPELIYNVEWVANGGTGEMEVFAMNPWQFVTDMFLMASSANHDNQLKRSGSLLAYRASRMDSYKSRPIGNDHVGNVVASIWLSRRWSTQEILATVLDGNYYGDRMIGIEQAAWHYFAKQASVLTIDEIVSLSLMTKSPSYYHPFCHADRFQQRAEYIAQRLFDNWPEHYVDYIFTKPDFVLTGCEKNR